MKRFLLIALLFVSAAAFGQTATAVWTSQMKTPMITGSATIKNDTTVTELWTLQTKPGYTYSIQEIQTADSVKVAAASFVASSVIITGVTLGGIDKLDWIRYQVNVKKHRTKLSYRYAMGDASAGQVQFRTGSITGPIFATIDLPPTGGWSFYQTAVGLIDFGIDANVDIYLTFTGSPRITGAGGNLVWFMFE
jgi:hypothetical protein